MFRVYIFTFLLFITIGCDTIIPEDINLNPNSPSEAPEDATFDQALRLLVGLEGEGVRVRYKGVWIRVLGFGLG